MSILSILVEWPLDVLEPQNKNEHIAHYERKRMAPGFTGFALLVTPGQVIDLKWIIWVCGSDFDEAFLEGHIKKVLQLGTPEKEYVFSLTNLMVLFIIIPVSYIGQVRSKLVTNHT